MLNDSYQNWRKQEVARVGEKVMQDAEALVDRRDAEPRIEVRDPNNGTIVKSRITVAEQDIKAGRKAKNAKSFGGFNFPFLMGGR